MIIARILLVIATTLIALGGCKSEKDATKASAAKAAAGEAQKGSAAFQAPVLQRLKDKGLAVSEFEQAAAKPYAARACVRGQVAKLDVLLCSYKTADEAEGKEAKLRGFAGSAVTGAVRIDQTVAMAVADRDKVDLKGKQINALLTAFVGDVPVAEETAKK